MKAIDLHCYEINKLEYAINDFIRFLFKRNKEYKMN